MKALSVKQPWASLIATGQKTIELRSWPTTYRGPLVIVASASPDGEALARFRLGHVPCGVTVAVVDVVDVRPAHASDEASALDVPAPRDFAWCLSNPRPLPLARIRGRLGLYEVDDAVAGSP